MNRDFAFLVKELQLKSGLEILTPADCELLNTAIETMINRSLSEIVLRRLFEFVPAKFPPTIIA
nr:hypothetical protein [Mucilaginibacter sp. E4BP6]NYE66619.1 hypothetical protein [Mucilaginibacter sp. E4BP6]